MLRSPAPIKHLHVHAFDSSNYECLAILHHRSRVTVRIHGNCAIEDFQLFDSNAGASVTERLQKEITERSSALSHHKHSTKVRKTNLPIVAKRPSKRGTLELLNLLSDSHKQGDTREGRDTLIPDTHQV